MRLSRRSAAAAALVVCTAALPALAATSDPTDPTATAFTPPVALFDDSGASTLGAEPSIEVDSKGEVYVTAPAGVPTGGCPFWNVHPDRLNADGLPYDYRGTIDTDHGGVSGGDCDISITPAADPTAAYDQVSVTSLSLANLTSNVTSDGGQTFFPVANNASQQVFGVDRQWQASDPGLDRHYLSVHDLATNNIQVSVSADGGYQYLQNTPAINPAEAPGAIGLGGNHFGTTAVNPMTHKLYIPFLAPSRAEATGGNEHAVWVAEGDPCAAVPCVKGQPAGPITWTDHEIYTAPADVKLSHIFPAIAIDKAGTVYVAWTGDTTAPGTTSSTSMQENRIFFTHSTLDDVTPEAWSTPVTVDRGDRHSNMFPWLIAGNAGQIAVVWYGAQLVDPTAPCGARTGSAGDTDGVNNNCRTDWTVQYAQTSNGTAPAPSFAVTTASPLLHQGSVCDSGTACLAFNGDRTLLDFFDIALDREGRPNIAYISDVRAPGTADVQYIRMCTGTSLTGVTFGGGCTPLTEPKVCTLADPQVSDPAGDATQIAITEVPGGPSQADLDLLEGRLSYDPTTGMHVRLSLTDVDPPGGTDEYIRVALVRAGDPTVNLVAERDATAATFSATSGGDPLDPTAPRTSAQLTGTFDQAANVVEIVISPAAYAALVPGSTLAAGDAWTVGTLLTQRDTGLLTLTADSGAGTCGFTATATSTAGSSPSPTTDASSSPSPSPTSASTSTPTPAAASASATTSPTSTPSSERAALAVRRFAGDNRIATAVQVSRRAFAADDSAGAVVLARSDQFADALAGTPLAAHVDGPVLLSSPSALSAETRDELRRVLDAGRTVHLLGGVRALSAAVEEEVRSLGFRAERHSAADRYGTAVAIAGELGAPSTVLLATGRDFADGLAAGVAAGHVGGVVLLSDGDKLPSTTRSYLAAHPGDRYAVGGPASRALPTARSLAGADRFATAALVAGQFFPRPSGLGIASGRGFADAMAGGPLLIALGNPLVLADRTTLPQATGDYLRTVSASVDSVAFFGGPAALDEGLEADVRNALGR